MSDTPRTDRAQFAAIPDAGRGSRFVVEADFSRRLERELAEVNRDKSQFITDEMVNRFLSWPLPKSVSSDGCATNPNYPHPRCGTNLLTADEARQMLEYVCNVNMCDVR